MNVGERTRRRAGDDALVIANLSSLNTKRTSKAFRRGRRKYARGTRVLPGSSILDLVELDRRFDVKSDHVACF